MITLITDVWEGEEPILTKDNNKEDFILLIENKVYSRVKSPKNGWTDELLREQVSVIAVPSKGSVIEAFVGTLWVGSSEV